MDDRTAPRSRDDGETGPDRAATPPAPAGGAVRVPSFNRDFAIVIGIDDYANDIPLLKTPVNDASRLADLLARDYCFEVTLMTGEVTPGRPAGRAGGGITHITGEVTKDRLTAFFGETLPGLVGKDDRVLVYFAGHGIALESDGGPKGYLIPQDARGDAYGTFLAMADLHGWLNKLPCRHLLVILDCCFAGAFRWASTRQVTLRQREELHKERFQRYLKHDAWQALTSTAYDQKAMDSLSVLGSRGREDDEHSPFALGLFQALGGGADLPINGKRDGVITATELYFYLREQVELGVEAAAGREQTPGLWPLKEPCDGEFIFLTRDYRDDLKPAPPLDIDKNPYRGLESYDEKHSKLFFGRNAQITKLAELVDKGPFTAVVGASGTGKSSLVKAGLLPCLRAAQAAGDGRAGGAERYSVLPPIRPTDHPVQALQSVLTANAAEAVREVNWDGDEALAEAVRVWSRDHPGRQLVLVIDQLEELATLCRPDERKHFLALLASALREQPQAWRLIVTLRTDFEPQIARNTPIEAFWISERRYIVPPMDQDDLRAAIIGPAAEYELYFEPPDLVDRLINEVIQTPGALPLLSFTLSELYVRYYGAYQQGRLDRALTQADFDALGGVLGSLRTRATEVYRILPDDASRATMEKVMLRMVSVEGGELARRRVPQSELKYPSDDENKRVGLVLERMTEARLLVSGTTEPAGDSPGVEYVEPAHDALVLAWDLLLEWKRKAQATLPLQRSLAQAAAEWRRSGRLWNDDTRRPQLEALLWPSPGGAERRPGVLLSISRLLSPRTGRPNDTAWLNAVETRFVQESVRRRDALLRRTVGIAALVILALAAIAAFAAIQRNSAVAAAADAAARGNALATEVVVRRTAEANAVAQDNARATEVVERTIAEANAVAQSNQRATAEVAARNAEATAVAENRLSTARELAASAIAQMPADAELGRLLALRSAGTQPTAEGEEALREGLLNPARAVLRSRSGAMWAVAFSPDGQYLVTNEGEDEETRLWEAATWQERNVPAAVAGAGSAAVWEALTGQPLNNGPVSPDTPYSVESPDRKYSATVDRNGRIVLQGPGGTTRTLAWGGNPQTTVRLAFSPDSLLVTASIDVPPEANVVRVWATGSGLLVSEMRGHTSWANDYAMSPTGQYVATAGDDGTARVWDVTLGEPLLALPGHVAATGWGAWSPDGKEILSVTDASEIAIVDAETGRLLRKWAVPGASIASASFSPTGGRIVAWGAWTQAGGPAYLLDVQTGGLLAVLKPAQGASAEPLFSPDGARLATAGNGLWIWDAGTGEQVYDLTGAAGGVMGFAWSAESQRLIVSRADGTAQVYEARSGRLITTLGQKSGRTVTLNPNGKLAAISGGGGSLRPSLWDVETGKKVSELPQWHGNQHDDVVFSPDGRLIATTTVYDNAVRVFDGETGQLAATLSGHTDIVRQAHFSADGRFLATGGDDHAAKIWNAGTGRLMMNLSGLEGDVYSLEFSPDNRLLAVLSHDVSGRFISQVYACRACGSFDQLVEDARGRVTRELTLAERQKYLHEAAAP